MNNQTKAYCTVVVLTFLVSVPQAVHADDDNRLTDASFELQLPPDKGGWTLFEISSFSPDESRTSRHSMFNAGRSRTVSYSPYFIGTVSGSYQEIPADPGSRWRLTGFGMAPIALAGTPAFGIVQVSFFDADGNDLGTVETADGTTSLAKTSNEVNNRTPVGEWILLDTGIVTAPSASATVQAFTLYVDYSGSDIGQGVYFDDLSLCALERDDDESACNDSAGGM